MQIVYFLFPKGVTDNHHRVLGRLPKPVLAVLAFLQYLPVDLRQMEGRMALQATSLRLVNLRISPMVCFRLLKLKGKAGGSREQ
jgi:hypothetical protein